MKVYSGLLDSSGRRRSDNGISNGNPQPTAKKQPVMCGTCIRSVAKDSIRRQPKSPLSGRGSAKRSTLSFNWPRNAFRDAKDRFDASFQELFLLVLTDGLADYCLKYGAPRDLRAVVPLGRAGDSSNSFASNQFDIGFVNLPAATTDPQQRLASLRQGLRLLRDQQSADVFPKILNFLGLLPNSARSYMANLWSTRANLLISVIPGRYARHKIGGATVQLLFAMPALPPSHGLVIGAIATSREIHVTVQVDPEIVPDPAELRECLAGAFQRLATWLSPTSVDA